MVLIMAVSLIPAGVQADELPSVNITTDWVGDGPTDVEHAYVLTFSDNGSYGLDIDLRHERGGALLASNHSIVWDSMGGARTARLTFDTALQWGDSIDLSVTITDHDGTTGLDLETSRILTVGRWNQPMADHEVLLSTSWAMDQNYTNDLGDQAFELAFTGQGWQERVGTTLSSWELGNGTFRTVESTGDGTTELDLVLTQLWKNETVVAGVLTSQVFDARGTGSLATTLIDGDTVTAINADVSEALLNRSVIEGVVGEHLSIEATGLLNISETGEENDSLSIDGELAVFLFEYVDVDGERVLQHTQFEAMADFVLIDEGSRLDVSLDGFTSVERWENGVRTQHLEELYGGGTFGYTEQDDNATVQVNATIHDSTRNLRTGRRSLMISTLTGLFLATCRGPSAW